MTNEIKNKANVEIRNRIFTIRGVQVMLDRDLAGARGRLPPPILN